jgi:hypothetical protein
MAAVAQRDQPLHEPYYGVIEEHIHQDQAGQHKRVGEVEAAYEEVAVSGLDARGYRQRYLQDVGID